MRLLGLALLLHLPLWAVAEPQIPNWPHAEEFSRWGPEQVDYLLGLGALQKVGGRWRHKASESVPGTLQRITWQVVEGHTAEEGFDWLQARVPAAATLLFTCHGRACGSSSQWASLVFEERELYGHAERQAYAAWRLVEEQGTWTIVLYASDRANRRHYLRMDLLRHADNPPGTSAAAAQ